MRAISAGPSEPVASAHAAKGSSPSRPAPATRGPSPISSRACSWRCFSFASHFGALDRQALEVGHGVFGVEDLAVEEGLLAARGRRGDLLRGNVQRLCGLAPQILALDFLDQ